MRKTATLPKPLNMVVVQKAVTSEKEMQPLIG